MLGKDGFLSSMFKKPDPKELVRKWQRDIRSEVRKIERQMRDVEREAKKAEKLCKESAKNNDIVSAKIIAKELVGARRCINQLYANKAQMISMQAALTEQLGVARVAGTLQKSTEVMATMNSLLKVPELNQAMQDMAKEMMKAGIMDEMVQDVLDSAIDTEDLEDEVDVEVEKVLTEVAGDYIDLLPTASNRTKIVAKQEVANEAEPSRQAILEGNDDGELGDLQNRLEAMRN
mmetsp:Transcript_25608/g.71606  ORF Transcript_25608/g.71606 Transcript_25608/m.71606 type:complete len:233 (-) Transcript_25608:300-998(-)|eukprot:CAMPEP_0117673146 /NCGR_PEP_ID=MMETSP0804-20121206/14310_1 /TAXON_ID=1074897 /ORGANISM="Tetraselmis astigmatica, Strain CCMP880" /LENGTH=232 /DNA_ID=CAMNT_0005481851 /DNA_START=54 /DNA_END=752 /DNA_ORIENTATION=+